MPDKSPLKPGHILLISKIHLRCHADARPEALAELDEVAVKVRRFLKEAYRTESLVWENGVSGQSVYHAHLHPLPAPINNIPPEFDSHGDVTRIEGWQPVRERFARHGSYLYAEYRGDRRLIVGYRPLMRQMRGLLERWTGAQWDGSDWIKLTIPEDVAEVGRRWETWAG